MGYQSRDDEADIVERRACETEDRLLARAVLVTRGTRQHSDVRVGSSVRGAIDLVEVATRLAAIRGVDVTDPEAGLDAALVALSGRIRLHEGGDTQPEDVIRDLWAQVLAAEDPGPKDDGDEGKVGAP